MSFFEGSEKKLEITVKKGELSLRELGREFWQSIAKTCKAEIISSKSNDQVDAYLLSESSLFVWGNRFVMITCGQTVMINAAVKFLKECNNFEIDSLIFQRKNEYISHIQQTSFYDDKKILDGLISGKAYRFGNLDGHHNFLYHLDSPYSPDKSDSTFELLMYHIEGKAASIFQNSKSKIEQIRQLLNLSSIFPNFKIDDNLFSPYGYSLNGIFEDKYFTIHVTPQSGNSYVSFETNLSDKNQIDEILNHVIKTFKPYTFDLITFNSENNNLFSSSYQEISSAKESLSCGYSVFFKQLSKIESKTLKAVQID